MDIDGPSSRIFVRLQSSGDLEKMLNRYTRSPRCLGPSRCLLVHPRTVYDTWHHRVVST